MNAIFPTREGPWRSAPGPLTRRNGRESAPALAPKAVNRETGLQEAVSWRRTLHRSKGLLVENSSVAATEVGPAGYETKHQVVLPYLGLFQYNVGKQGCYIDTACTLFVLPDREYQDVHPVRGLGHAGIVINLEPDVLEEIIFAPKSRRAFSDMVRPASRRLKLITHQILRCLEAADDPLFADEWIIAALTEAFGTQTKTAPRNPAVLANAKLLLHAREGERLSLDAIAREVGVSGVYLTQEFSRAEGIPLYRYQLQLRMNRALLELPHCEDITRLALDLGFSSHSHFTSSFRRHFGMTPSDYRKGHSISLPHSDRPFRDRSLSGPLYG